MKITCKRENLAAILKAVSPAIAKPNKVKPVRACVLFDAGTGLQVEANDGEIAVRATVGETAVYDKGQALFPHRLLTEILDNATDESVAIEVDDGKLEVTFERAHYEMPSWNVADFTSRRFAEPKPDGIEINAALLAGLIESVDFCEGKERTGGVQVSVLENKINAVCTNGKSLAVAKGDPPPGSKEIRDMVLPVKTFELVANVFGDSNVRLTLDGAHLSIVGVTASIVSTLMASAFPAWRKIMPATKPATRFVCNVGEFARTMRQAIGVLSADTNMVDVEIESDRVKVVLQEEKDSFFSSMQFGGTLTGSPVKMWMNPVQIAKALKPLNVDTEIAIEVWKAESPWRLASEKSEALFAPTIRQK